MKFNLLVLFVVLSAFVGSSVAFKNPECGEPHSADGSNGAHCMAYFPGWSYNADAKECVSFVYGGCGGNNNRFGSKETCEKTCVE
ncbi:male accessory gland serine protease inhibitor-like [Drosophila innubila]|uniref:male accessory gland serine protease inhibitor-like n=1 Tax=Drosophila innubila TaxID=198719 RepID=UPI00148B93A3|nr:male accessory gland serine protease inhibitor-like [Drosophila innubila]